ncbi:MAG: DUF4167 domain-containing protein [Hellea sp.]|jgi:hypothetical protein
MKRQRGRNRNNNNRSNNTNPNRSLDSNGPGVKVRGNVSTIYEKYSALARDAQSSGNRVNAENLKQHAEHYLRLMNEMETARVAAQAERDAQRVQRNETESSGEEIIDSKTGRAQSKKRNSIVDNMAVLESDESLEESPEGNQEQGSASMDENPPRRRRKAPPRKKTEPVSDAAE